MNNKKKLQFLSEQVLFHGQKTDRKGQCLK